MNLHCCHCKRAERTELGTLVVGKLNGRPYRAVLCADHRQMLIDDGLVLPPAAVRSIPDPYFSPAAEAERNAKMAAIFAAARARLDTSGTIRA